MTMQAKVKFNNKTTPYEVKFDLSEQKKTLQERELKQIIVNALAEQYSLDVKPEYFNRLEIISDQMSINLAAIKIETLEGTEIMLQERPRIVIPQIALNYNGILYTLDDIFIGYENQLTAKELKEAIVKEFNQRVKKDAIPGQFELAIEGIGTIHHGEKEISVTSTTTCRMLEKQGMLNSIKSFSQQIEKFILKNLQELTLRNTRTYLRKEYHKYGFNLINLIDKESDWKEVAEGIHCIFDKLFESLKKQGVSAEILLELLEFQRELFIGEEAKPNFIQKVSQQVLNIGVSASVASQADNITDAIAVVDYQVKELVTPQKNSNKTPPSFADVLKQIYDKTEEHKPRKGGGVFAVSAASDFSSASLFDRNTDRRELFLPYLLSYEKLLDGELLRQFSKKEFVYITYGIITNADRYAFRKNISNVRQELLESIQALISFDKNNNNYFENLSQATILEILDGALTAQEYLTLIKKFIVEYPESFAKQLRDENIKLIIDQYLKKSKSRYDFTKSFLDVLEIAELQPKLTTNTVDMFVGYLKVELNNDKSTSQNVIRKLAGIKIELTTNANASTNQIPVYISSYLDKLTDEQFAQLITAGYYRQGYYYKNTWEPEVRESLIKYAEAAEKSRQQDEDSKSAKKSHQQDEDLEYLALGNWIKQQLPRLKEMNLVAVLTQAKDHLAFNYLLKQPEIIDNLEEMSPENFAKLIETAPANVLIALMKKQALAEKALKNESSRAALLINNPKSVDEDLHNIRKMAFEHTAGFENDTLASICKKLGQKINPRTFTYKNSEEHEWDVYISKLRLRSVLQYFYKQLDRKTIFEIFKVLSINDTDLIQELLIQSEPQVVDSLRQKLSLADITNLIMVVKEFSPKLMMLWEMKFNDGGHTTLEVQEAIAKFVQKWPKEFAHYIFNNFDLDLQDYFKTDVITVMLKHASEVTKAAILAQFRERKQNTGKLDRNALIEVILEKAINNDIDKSLLRELLQEEKGVSRLISSVEKGHLIEIVKTKQVKFSISLVPESPQQVESLVGDNDDVDEDIEYQNPEPPVAFADDHNEGNTYVDTSTMRNISTANYKNLLFAIYKVCPPLNRAYDRLMGTLNNEDVKQKLIANEDLKLMRRIVQDQRMLNKLSIDDVLNIFEQQPDLPSEVSLALLNYLLINKKYSVLDCYANLKYDKSKQLAVALFIAIQHHANLGDKNCEATYNAIVKQLTPDQILDIFRLKNNNKSSDAVNSLMNNNLHLRLLVKNKQLLDKLTPVHIAELLRGTGVQNAETVTRDGYIIQDKEIADKLLSRITKKKDKDIVIDLFASGKIKTSEVYQPHVPKLLRKLNSYDTFEVFAKCYLKPNRNAEYHLDHTNALLSKLDFNQLPKQVEHYATKHKIPAEEMNKVVKVVKAIYKAQFRKQEADSLAATWITRIAFTSFYLGGGLVIPALIHYFLFPENAYDKFYKFWQRKFQPEIIKREQLPQTTYRNMMDVINGKQDNATTQNDNITSAETTSAKSTVTEVEITEDTSNVLTVTEETPDEKATLYRNKQGELHKVWDKEYDVEYVYMTVEQNNRYHERKKVVDKLVDEAQKVKSEYTYDDEYQPILSTTPELNIKPEKKQQLSDKLDKSKNRSYARYAGLWKNPEQVNMMKDLKLAKNDSEKENKKLSITPVTSVK